MMLWTYWKVLYTFGSFEPGSSVPDGVRRFRKLLKGSSWVLGALGGIGWCFEVCRLKRRIRKAVWFWRVVMVDQLQTTRSQNSGGNH